MKIDSVCPRRIVQVMIAIAKSDVLDDLAILEERALREHRPLYNEEVIGILRGRSPEEVELAWAVVEAKARHELSRLLHCSASPSCTSQTH